METAEKLDTSQDTETAEGQAPKPVLQKPVSRKFLKPETLKSLGIGAVSLFFGILVWHILTEINFDFYINFENVPSPGRVLTAFIGHLQTEVFYVHIGVSMRRILISY
jgi:NitT/TauT family transport system permease protein